MCKEALKSLIYDISHHYNQNLVPSKTQSSKTLDMCTALIVMI